MPDGCKTAEVFMTGRSQAVRLPEDWSWLDGVAGTLDDDFVEAALEHPGEQPRAELDRLAR